MVEYITLYQRSHCVKKATEKAGGKFTTDPGATAGAIRLSLGHHEKKRFLCRMMDGMVRKGSTR